jgi:hypothetical protein
MTDKEYDAVERKLRAILEPLRRKHGHDHEAFAGDPPPMPKKLQAIVEALHRKFGDDREAVRAELRELCRDDDEIERYIIDWTVHDLMRKMDKEERN